MRSLFLAPSCVAVLGFLHAGAAGACEITEVAPTGVIPTYPSQPFTFVASNDCTMLSFSAMGGSITKTPRPGRMVGADSRRYTVTLFTPEWSMLASSDIRTFAWTVSGTTGGMQERVTTRNELDFDADGWTRTDGDLACDLNALRNPGLPEICDNGIDDDCDGFVDGCAVSLDDADLLIEGEHPSTSPYNGIGDAVGIGDLDGDGAADVLLGDPSPGLAHIVYGPISGVIGSDTGAALRAHQPGAGGFGVSVTAGHADGDGFADAVVGAPGVASAYLFLGPITGDRVTRDADVHLLGRPDNRDATGGSVLVGFDHDGDSNGDIAVGALEYKAEDGMTGGHTRGALFVAPATDGDVDLETEAPYVYIGDNGTDELGTSIATLGDWNGDGVDELAVGAPRGGSVYVLEGGDTPGRFFVGDVAAATIGHEDDSDEFGWSLAAADYDGDGTSDVFVGAPGVRDFEGPHGVVATFLGPIRGRVGLDYAHTTWEGDPVRAISVLGEDVAVGDVDGDAEPDVLMGDRYGGPNGLGGVYLQVGVASGMVSVHDLLTFPSGRNMELGTAVDFVPDWTGDGAAEVLFGARSWPTVASDAEVGAVWVFFSDSLFP